MYFITTLRSEEGVAGPGLHQVEATSSTLAREFGHFQYWFSEPCNQVRT